MPALFGSRPQGLGAPQSGGLGGLTNVIEQFNAQNPGALMALGAGIMNRNPAQGFAAAAPLAAQGQQKNATAQYLLSKGIAKSPEEAMALAGQPELLKLAIKNPDEYSQRAEAATRFGLKPDDPRYQPFVLDLNASGAERPEVWSVTPTYGKDPKTGKTVLGTGSDRGNWKVLDTSGGFEPYSPYDKSFERSAGGAAGKIEGDAVGNLDSMNANMPGLQQVVTELGTLADTATYTPAGKMLDAGMRWADMEPRDAAVARTKYMAMVDNQVLPLLRETFGPQFTVVEGESLRATLGAPDKTPAEKKAVLESFIEQKQRNIEALSRQTGQTVPPSAGGNTRLRFNPATGELE